MTLLAWIGLGLLAGFIASHLVNHRGEGMILDILLGIVGAVVGGWLTHVLGYSDITALHAAIGTRAELVTFHGPTARAHLTAFTRSSLCSAVTGGALDRHPKLKVLI